MSAIFQLCEAIDANNIDASVALLDPCFFSAKDYQQNLPDDIRERILDHLAHRIQRSPADLIAHLQRLKIYYQSDSQDGLYGALLDLFIALGHKGKPLRLRMLRGFSGKLTKQQRQIFKVGIENGIFSTDITQLSRYSRLSGAISGSLQIIEYSAETNQILDTTLIDEVRDLLDSGQVEPAQELLEKALLESPDQEELSIELLMIYRHTKNIDAFQNTYKTLSDRPLAAKTEWDQQAVAFGL